MRVPDSCLPNSSSIFAGSSCASSRLPLSMSSMLVVKLASGAPLTICPPLSTRLLTVPSRGMVTLVVGTATTPASAWLTKYMPYNDLATKPKAATPTTNTPSVTVTALRRPKALRPDPPSFCLRALVKLSRCRVLSTSPMLISSPDRWLVMMCRNVAMSRGSRFWNCAPIRPLSGLYERTWNSMSMDRPRLSTTNCRRPRSTSPTDCGCLAWKLRPPADRSSTLTSWTWRWASRNRSLAGMRTRACWRWASDSCTTLTFTAVFMVVCSC